MRRLRVLVPMHEDLIPPETLEGQPDKEIVRWKTQYDVVTQLRELGHEVRPLGVWSDLGVIRQAILDWKPHIVFNLVEEFHGVALYNMHVASYLELMRQPYTGCNPRGLMLSRDKALTKKVLSFHRIRLPGFAVFPRRSKVRRPAKLRFPLVVKSRTEEGSYGISQASIVTSDEKLRERVEYMHEQLETDAIVEEFVEGREFYVGLLGHRRLRALPVIELDFGKMPEGSHWIATSKVKWDWEYQKKWDIRIRLAEGLPPDVEKRMVRLAKRVFRGLYLSGYARIDLRLTPGGELYVLEANPNADVGYGEEMSMAGEAIGMDYGRLIQRILNLGLSYPAEWSQVTWG